MKRIEKSPQWYDKENFDAAIEIRNKFPTTEILTKINSDYLYWDKVKYLQTPTNMKPEILWTLTKLSRVLNAGVVNFGKYRFKFNPTDSIQKALHQFDLHIGGNLGAKSIIPGDDKKKYLVSSIMEEAIASSQIEGAVTTRKAAKEMLRKNAKPQNKSEQMILNNYQTVRLIVDIKNEPLTLERLFEIHRLITYQTLDDETDEGRFRENNEIDVVDAIDGEIVYTPPSYKEIPELVNELLHFFNENDPEKFIHPIIKGCIIHFMIGFIHPFVDGNGRTARALFYWYLLKNGYWLTEYLSISRLIVKSKTQYARAYLYTEIDENDLTYFIHYKMKVMQLAYDDLHQYIGRKIKEKRILVNFQKIKGINERQAQIIKWIYEEPDLVFSVKEIENRFSTANQTARTDLTALQHRGYLNMIELNGKTKGFCRSADFAERLKKDMEN